MSQSNKTNPNWKGQLYIVGLGLGAVIGFLSAYLYAREAETEAEQEGQRPEVSPIAMLGLATSTLSLVRMFAQTPKQQKEDKTAKDRGKK
jgi:hypothetical protein